MLFLLLLASLSSAQLIGPCSTYTCDTTQARKILKANSLTAAYWDNKMTQFIRPATVGGKLRVTGINFDALNVPPSQWEVTNIDGISRITQLTYFKLGNRVDHYFYIPDEFGRLKNLDTLDLEGSGLYFGLPDSITNIPGTNFCKTDQATGKDVSTIFVRGNNLCNSTQLVKDWLNICPVSSDPSVPASMPWWYWLCDDPSKIESRPMAVRVSGPVTAIFDVSGRRVLKMDHAGIYIVRLGKYSFKKVLFVR